MKTAPRIAFLMFAVGLFLSCGPTVDIFLLPPHPSPPGSPGPAMDAGASLDGAVDAALAASTSMTCAPACTQPNTLCLAAQCRPVVPGHDFVVGTRFSCALDNGKRLCWGRNSSGELGNGTMDNALVPIAQDERLDWTGLAGRVGRHACGTTSDGGVLCWGNNGAGQLGIGNQEHQLRPQPLPSPTGGGLWAQISPGSSHSCGLSQQGVVHCWGSNDDGELGFASETSRPVPVALAWYAVDVSPGWGHTCVLDGQGGVACWGRNDVGQLGRGHNKVEPGYQRVMLDTKTAVVQLAAQGKHTCVATAAGQVLCWGNNADGQLGIGDFSSHFSASTVPLPGPARQIATGRFNTCAILEQGALFCWGNVGWATGDQSDPQDAAFPQAVAQTQTWRTVMCGYNHCCARDTQDALWCWGANDNGQLGTGTLIPESTPVRILAIP